MIAVTCRNGEHFAIDPDEIERIETVPHTVVHLIGGRTYVLQVGLDELLRSIRDARAVRVVVRKRMTEGPLEAPARADSALFVERRAHHRDGDSPGSPPTAAPPPTPDRASPR